MKKACGNCKHSEYCIGDSNGMLSPDEWWECHKRPHMANLKQFPTFKNLTCWEGDER